MAWNWRHLIEATTLLTSDEDSTVSQYIDALERNRLQLVRKFLRRGLNPNTHAGDYVTGLHIAASSGFTGILKLLLAHPDININLRNAHGCTALFEACQKNQAAVVRLLLGSGADIEIPDKNGYTPLQAAVMWKYEEVVSVLLDNNANVNKENVFGKTALYIAVLDNPALAIARKLIRKGADVNLNNGKTMPLLLELSLCLARDQYKMMKLLLDAGADVNIRDRLTQRTALHMVAISGNADISNLLIKHGANHTLRDFQNRTPLDYAKNQGNQEVSEVFATAKPPRRPSKSVRRLSESIPQSDRRLSGASGMNTYLISDASKSPSILQTTSVPRQPTEPKLVVEPKPVSKPKPSPDPELKKVKKSRPHRPYISF